MTSIVGIGNDCFVAALETKINPYLSNMEVTILVKGWF